MPCGPVVHFEATIFNFAGLAFEVVLITFQAGLSEKTVSSWEKCNRKPKKENVAKLLGFCESKGAEAKAVAYFIEEY